MVKLAFQLLTEVRNRLRLEKWRSSWPVEVGGFDLPERTMGIYGNLMGFMGIYRGYNGIYGDL